MTRKQKKTVLRIAVSVLLLVAAILIPYHGAWSFLLFFPAYFTIGWDVLLKAVRSLFRGSVLDENFLMALATVGAFGTGFFGEGQYSEAVFVMLFYQVGELFQDYAVNRSRRSIASLMDIRPDYANVERDGELVRVDPDEVGIGDIVTVRPGEKIPIDGTVTEGSSFVDTSALTGESVPKEVSYGSSVISGCINQTGVLKVRTEKLFGESTVSKILDLVENSASKKAKTENFITRFAKYYTPAVVISALILAFIPPIFFGELSSWVHRALIFLVVSCPCALVISVPLSFFGGIGRASRDGILVKGGNYLEALAQARIAVFDKTGTLTEGSFRVSNTVPVNMSREELLSFAAAAEGYSTHPIAKALREACKEPAELSNITDAREIHGKGVCALIGNTRVLAGNSLLMQEEGIESLVCDEAGTAVHVAVNGEYAGYIVISDTVKENAALTVKALRAAGIKKTVMLTGDTESIGESVARQVGVDEVYAQLLPVDKVEITERLLREKVEKDKLIFVGDGVNDAPVISRADIGIAMGALGSDAAIEAADIVLMDDNISKIVTAIGISKKTLRIVKQNIFFALFVKAAVLILSVFGLSGMWQAIFADVGVSVIAILNSLRILYKARK